MARDFVRREMSLRKSELASYHLGKGGHTCVFCSFRLWGPKKGMAGGTRHMMGPQSAGPSDEVIHKTVSVPGCVALSRCSRGNAGPTTFSVGVPSRGERATVSPSACWVVGRLGLQAGIGVQQRSTAQPICPRAAVEAYELGSKHGLTFLGDDEKAAAAQGESFGNPNWHTA